MARRFAIIGILAALAAAGCGKGGSTSHAPGGSSPRALGRIEVVETVCGNLRARLEGVASEASLRDPQLSLFRSPDEMKRRLLVATRRALGVLREGRAEMAKASEAAARFVVDQTRRDYESFAARLPDEHPAPGTPTFRLSVHYQRSELLLERRCRRFVEAR